MNSDHTNLSLKKRAKTFYFASLFFAKEIQNDIETLYFFCRYIDDIGDSKKGGRQFLKKSLESIRKQLREKNPKNEIVSAFLDLTCKYNIDIKIPIDLINGVIGDLENVNISDYDELITYSYKVAGTVGFMMCKIMNVRDKKIIFKGIQLGIAMQFTNIARDIKEDLESGRIYFPKEFRLNIKENFHELISKPNLQKIFSKDLQNYLDLTDKIYKTAWKGIISLPFKYKIPISVAAYLYQSIGSKIRRKKYNVWNERVYLSTFEKLVKSLRVIYMILFYNSKSCDQVVDKRIKKILKIT